MCGIAGFIRKDDKLVSVDVVKQMTDKLVHRGPDAEGQFAWRSVGLGHEDYLFLIYRSRENSQWKAQMDILLLYLMVRYIIIWN